MERGYVKLWRKTLDSGLLSNDSAWRLFGYLLLNAAWKKTKYSTRYGIIDLEPGQLIIGRKKVSKQINLSEQQIRTALKLLTTGEIVTIESTKSYSVITIRNWVKYQSPETQSTNEITISQPSANHQLTTVKEGIEGKALNTNTAFEAFWTKYPPRKGKKANKALAQTEWNKLKPDTDLQSQMLKALEGYSGDFVVDACRWIKHKRWLDETVKAEPKKIMVAL